MPHKTKEARSRYSLEYYHKHKNDIKYKETRRKLEKDFILENPEYYKKYMREYMRKYYHKNKDNPKFIERKKKAQKKWIENIKNSFK